MNKKKINNSMNFARVIVEIFFGSLKNRWQILKIFISNINKAPSIVIACCVLHNYYEMWKIPKSSCVNYAARRDNLVGFRFDKLPTLTCGKHLNKQENQ
jgi:hypothetical protein